MIKPFTIHTNDNVLIDLNLANLVAVKWEEGVVGIELVMIGMPVIPVPGLTRDEFWEIVNTERRSPNEERNETDFIQENG